MTFCLNFDFALKKDFFSFSHICEKFLLVNHLNHCMGRSELEEKIRDWAIDEGILGKPLPSNPKVNFGYELNFPPNSPKPMRLMVIQPKGTKAISIQIATQIAKQHVEELHKSDPQGLMKFFVVFKRYMLMQNLLYNVDAKNARYVILENIYPDGLNENMFYQAIRKVFNANVFMNMQLVEFITRKRGGGNISRSDTDLDFSAGTMFT
ncbi:MAG: hypothetical protein DRO88_01450 [Promethearchaeia archaeon]|nr:MAG: hypothetical protein DRO88_01450 [Candidatus Lokiarchaeia archaeon]